MLAAGLIAGASVAGCADDPATAPRSASRPTATVPEAVAAAPPKIDAAAAPDVIVLQRVTSPGRGHAPSRARTERREVWRIGTGALASRGGIVRLSAPTATDRPARGPATAVEAAQQAAELPPVPVLQLPALPASAVCGNAPAWERTSNVGGLTVIARGRGDVPWSTIEVWSQGRLVTRSQSTWERRRGSWQLVAHEDVSVADGASSRVRVDRSTVRPAAGDVVVPSVTCADRKAGIVREAATPAVGDGAGRAVAWSAGLGPVGLAGLELAAAVRVAGDECSPTEEDAEAACELLRLLVIGAAASLTGAATAMWAACMPPAVLTGVPCIGALAGYTAASVALTAAQNAYSECKEAARQPAPTCGCPPTNPPAATDASMTSDVVGTALPTPARSALDCAAPTTPTAGGGGGGGGGTAPGGTGGGYYQIICIYYDHYDGDGNYLYTTEEGCHYQWMQ